MFSANSITEAQAQLIADAFYRAGKNPARMAKALGVAAFDINIMRHPLVKRKIQLTAQRIGKVYTLEDHLFKLQEIRDAALDEGNFRVALASEISVGKAAGLYDKAPEDTTGEHLDPNQLSTEEIRRRLAAAPPAQLEDHTAESPDPLSDTVSRMMGDGEDDF